MAEVKALAALLAEHEGRFRATIADREWMWRCTCGAYGRAITSRPDEAVRRMHRAHLEAAVLDWVRERLADAQYAMAQALPGLLVDEYGEDSATWSELGSTRRLAGELSGIASKALGVEEEVRDEG